MKRVAAKLIPKLLNPNQKKNRMLICQDMKQSLADDPDLLSKIITGDETWVYGYDPETKFQSSQWKSPGSPRPKKARQSRSQVKVMLIVFFDISGVVHHEYIPKGQTVNQHVYKEVLIHLRDAIRRKRPELWSSGDYYLHHDNAPAHTALKVRNYLAKNKVSVLPQPPYSPDLAPCDFYLFPKLKIVMKGQCYDDVDAIKQKTDNELRCISRESFRQYMQAWVKRWDHCKSSSGCYFEGDKFD